MSILNVFGSYLKETRKSRKVTQEQLAISLNVSTVYVHQLETAKVDAPDKSKCSVIAQTLNIDPDVVWNKAKEQKLLRFLNKENIVNNLDEPITYSDLSGSWDLLEYDDFYPVDIDNRGAFNFDVDGCIVSGRFSIPNNTLSIFSVEYSVSGDNTCKTGDYSGLGALVEDELVAIGTNSEYATILTAVKSNR